MAPIPADLLVLLLNSSAADPAHYLTLLSSMINRIPNPSFIPVSEAVADERFARLTALTSELRLAQTLEFVQSSQKEDAFALWIHDYAPSYNEQVSQLLDFLDITGVAIDGKDIFLPLSSLRQEPTAPSVWIQTRSVHNLARIFSAAVDVPEEDRASGLALEYPPLGLVGELIKIRRSVKRPANAVSATKYRTWWYYIDGGDAKSKVSFDLFQVLWATRLSETAKTFNAAPLLTIPAN